MFGYVICNKSGLTQQELARYQRIYCGLCRTLKKRYGELERFGLSYDMTFLALFLSALYEPEESGKEFRCVLHPFQKKYAADSPYLDYAADMTVLMTYYKCMDDWEDDHNHISLQCAKVLKKYFGELEKKYPRQCAAVAASIRELARLEKSPEAGPDETVNCSGMLLAELFVVQEDFWSGSLRRFGYELGRFIYLMDAAMDYKKDLKKERYNPLRKMQKEPQEAEDILVTAIGNATAEFEKLPIVQDAHLIRNILYGGVWQQYYAKVLGKEKHDG